MYNISPVQWAKRLRYRSEHLGWFVAAILFVLLAHLLLLVGLPIIRLTSIPIYAGIFLLGLSFASVSVFVYFAVRMLAPVESVQEYRSTNRRILLYGLLGGLFLVQIGGMISNYLLDIPQEVLTPIAPLIAILYYSTAILVGYDGARMKNSIDRIEEIGSHGNTDSLLYEVIRGKSPRKAAAGGIGILLIGGIAGLFTSAITGLTVAGSIATILAFVLQLYPDEGY